MPALNASSSPAMCGVVPTPPEPKFIGRSSPWLGDQVLIDLIGELALTTATSGEMPIIARP
jgi:hypothetical protein